MTQTILVKEDFLAYITCPACLSVKQQDVSSFMGVKSRVRIRCRCKCGNKFHVQLERRLFARKDVSFPVECRVNKTGYKLQGTVTDISQSGLRIHLEAPAAFDLEIGVRVSLSFHLDDRDHSLIEMGGTIQSVKDLSVGMAFDSTQHYGKLGLYIEFH